MTNASVIASAGMDITLLEVSVMYGYLSSFFPEAPSTVISLAYCASRAGLSAYACRSSFSSHLRSSSFLSFFAKKLMIRPATGTFRNILNFTVHLTPRGSISSIGISTSTCLSRYFVFGRRPQPSNLMYLSSARSFASFPSTGEAETAARIRFTTVSARLLR